MKVEEGGADPTLGKLLSPVVLCPRNGPCQVMLFELSTVVFQVKRFLRKQKPDPVRCRAKIWRIQSESV